jgi:hypothetical protein
MKSRLVIMGLGVVLAASACGEQRLGRQDPACDELTTTIIMEAQAVPGLGYAACINDLKIGWSYEHLVAESGRSRFWLSSDRVGDRFVEVMVAATCDISEAVEVASDEPGITRYERIERADFETPLTVVPEGAEMSSRVYAAELALDLEGTMLAGRDLDIIVADASGTTADRIAAALQTGGPVLVAGTRGQEMGTVELQLPVRPGVVEVKRDLPLDDALEEIEEELGTARYRATWFYVFDGGCATYHFDARGPTVRDVPTDVADALGFMDLTEPRELARRQGLVVP